MLITIKKLGCLPVDEGESKTVEVEEIDGSDKFDTFEDDGIAKSNKT